MRIKLTQPTRRFLRKSMAMVLSAVMGYTGTVAPATEAIAAYVKSSANVKVRAFQDRKKTGYFSPVYIKEQMETAKKNLCRTSKGN